MELCLNTVRWSIQFICTPYNSATNYHCCNGCCKYLKERKKKKILGYIGEFIGKFIGKYIYFYWAIKSY